MKERLRVGSDNERVLKDELSDAKTRIAHMESKVGDTAAKLLRDKTCRKDVMIRTVQTLSVGKRFIN